jgi:hypothetical protein
MFFFSLGNRKSFEEDDKSDESSDDDAEPELTKVDDVSIHRTEKSAAALSSSGRQKDKETMNASDKRLMEEKNDSVVAHFFLALVWSIGGVLKQSSRDKFNQFFNDLCDNSIGKHPK